MHACTSASLRHSRFREHRGIESPRLRNKTFFRDICSINKPDFRLEMDYNLFVLIISIGIVPRAKRKSSDLQATLLTHITLQFVTRIY